MVRVRFFRVVLALPAVLFLGALLMSYASVIDVLTLFFLLWMAALIHVVFLFAFRCPRCGASAYAMHAEHGIRAALPVPNRVCVNCGYDFIKGEIAAEDAVAEPAPTLAKSSSEADWRELKIPAEPSAEVRTSVAHGRSRRAAASGRRSRSSSSWY
ncbi:hypothetical protein Rvan_2736 [Rhodomicrobium vannielii ATCC 17100]|uniref:Uncharacterized protein n=1 Tax=Rhodomicrobium vannielii (strain ATCC 17100 / DSM 162 / LMG 4299 / NCIMB 10020 / ATH 3.1.1) TaxID=648757 RepID=E3I821_RHOVT|nr:hypothetical protein Rvan_2736 [Rhodomicrobium vannielii ATCC 17100]